MRIILIKFFLLKILIITKKSSITVRFFISFQFLEVCLKIADKLQWNWKTVFWCSWLVIIIASLYLCGVFVLLFCTIYYLIRGEGNSYQCFKKIFNNKKVIS